MSTTIEQDQTAQNQINQKEEIYKKAYQAALEKVREIKEQYNQANQNN
jgi:hypothetical protein